MESWQTIDLMADIPLAPEEDGDGSVTGIYHASLVHHEADILYIAESACDQTIWEADARMGLSNPLS